MPIKTRRATLADLDIVAPLFDAYRQFYDQPADLQRAQTFLHARLSAGESVILLAYLDGADEQQTAGFTQLYPMFSSVRAERTFMLNDLYVTPDARRSGVGEALLHAASDYGRSQGAIRLELETMPDNLTAQSLYRAQGWQFYQGTFRFQLPLQVQWQDE